MTSIRLLLPGGESPQTLQLPPSATMQQLTALVRELPAVPPYHTLRFIHAGRMLTDPNTLPENAVVHVALTQPSQHVHVTLEIDENLSDDSPRIDWVTGFCMGVLMGLIMLVLSQDRSIALSRKCRTGVSIGAMINVIFGIFLVITDR